MNEDRKRILGLLAEGKITADEAERLIAALERRTPVPEAAIPGRPAARDRSICAWKSTRTAATAGRPRSTSGCR